MKNSFFIRASVFITGVALILTTQSYADTPQCDQTFAPQTLRYGFDYNFWDSYTNLNSYKHGLLNNWSVDFTEAYDYNLSTAVPDFAWTQNIKDSGYLVPGGASGVKVLSSSNWYSIKAVPPTGRAPDNLVVKYHLNYYGEQSPGNWVGPVSHTECQPYEISWCGDGVKDTNYNESCDDGAANGQPGKCNTSCTAVVPNPPAPICGNGIKEGSESCDDGTNNGKPGMCNNSCTAWVPPTPINGVCGSDNGKNLSVTPVNLCSIGTASAISGKWNWSCTGSNGGVNASCNANPSPVCGDGVKNGTESCDPNDTTKTGWGNTGCNTSCQPTNATLPACDSSKIGVQTSKLTQGYCTNGSVSAFSTTSSGNTENYTWSCNNTPATAVSCNANYTYTPSINQCDQTFTGTLRYGKSYNFYDVVSNSSPYAMKLTNFDFTYTEQRDYNLSSSFPSFAWNPSLIANNNIIPSGTKDYTTTYTTSKYPINAVPTQRSFDNLKLNYRLSYSLGGVGPFEHNECVNYEISWCGDGMIDSNEGEQCDDGANNGKIGSCNNSCSGTVPTLSCGDGVKNGAESCDPADGTKAGWGAYGCDISCNPITTPPVTGNFDLRIKKYVKSDDVFAGVDKTENFNYTVVVENVGTGKTSGRTTVKDQLPPSVTLRATPSGNGWTCSGNVGDSSFTCTTDAIVDAQQLFSVITIPSQVTNLAFRNDGYVNYAYVQNPNEMDGKQCNANNAMPNPALAGDNGQDPTKVCNEDKNNFDAATINPPNPNGFDLELHKYVSGDDNSTHGIPGGTLDYTFLLQNLGEMSSSGRTTVTDNDFPAGITISSIATTQAEWTCTKNLPTKFTCYTDRSLAKGEAATLIHVTAKIPSNMPVGEYKNVACLSNPYDPNENQPFDPSTGKYKVNNCNPVVVVITPANSFDLKLKKYVSDITSGTPERDGDHQTADDGNDVDHDILTVQKGGKVEYRFVVTNLGAVTATGITTVEDTLPNGTSITAVRADGWNCSHDDRKFTCTRTEDLAKDVSFPQIFVDANVSSTILAGEYSNTATLHNPGDTNSSNNTDPANIQIVTDFDLSVKKYVNTDVNPSLNDAQDLVHAFDTTTNANINYIIQVKNEGPASSTGITTIKDKLPAGVTQNGAATGDGWDCSYDTTGLLTCSSIQVVPKNGLYANIKVPVKVTLSADQSANNYTTVYNPNETKGCNSVNGPTTGTEVTCQNDTKNIDVAVIHVTGTVVGIPLYTKSCINGVSSCSVNNYPSIQACTDTKGTCYDTIDSCNGAAALSCTTGPTNPTGPGGGTSTNQSGRCGDGLTQPAGANGIAGDADDEQCDLGNGNSDVGTCTTSCKINFTTHPGANPITGLFLSIPGFSNIGQSTLNLDHVPFEKNNVVVGKDTNIFTLADRLDFSITTLYDIPLMIPADDLFCLSGIGDAVTRQTICNPAARYTQPKNVNGTNYVIMGYGMYQIRRNDGTYYNVLMDGRRSSMTLFKGADISPISGGGQVTLRDAFKGSVNTGTDGSIVLFNHDPVSDPTGAINMAAFNVHVSGVMVGSSTSVVNRSIDAYFRPNGALLIFLGGFTRTISGTTSTATNTTSSNINVPIINVPSVSASNVNIGSMSDLNGHYNLNGNQNIFSIKGNVTIGAVGSPCAPFMIDGVRTLIVEGNLTINCNIAYVPDTGASWAFIVKNGNIIIHPNITNLAGVYLVIAGSNNPSGQFRSVNDLTTNNILKVEGSMYGDPKPLFDSRLYVRGSSAYDILTPGVILNYSNRALVNPPPLLSEYLNNYTVNKVVK